jgi:hypothetical protein
MDETMIRRSNTMIMRWLSCGTGSVHIVGTCPDCYATQGGLLLGTAAAGFAGRISAKCVDCGKNIDYYIDASQEKIWKLDPVESRGVRVE